MRPWLVSNQMRAKRIKHVFNEDCDFIESGVNTDIPLRKTNNMGKKSSKCSQCVFESGIISK